MLGLQCSTVCSRDVDVDADRQKKKFGHGEEWKRSVGLIKLLMRKFSGEFNEDRQILNSIWQTKHRWIGHILRRDGLLHEIMNGRQVNQQDGGEEFKCYIIWQMMMALLHSTGS